IALLFLSLDGIFRTRGVGWMVAGIFAVGLSILAGHPQTVYYGLLGAGLYGVIRLVGAPERLKVILLSLGLVVGGFLLAGVQMLPGWMLTRQAIRRTGVEYQFSTQTPMPPENLLTLVNGGIFGRTWKPLYFGR